MLGCCRYLSMSKRYLVAADGSCCSIAAVSTRRTETPAGGALARAAAEPDDAGPPCEPLSGRTGKSGTQPAPLHSRHAPRHDACRAAQGLPRPDTILFRGREPPPPPPPPLAAVRLPTLTDQDSSRPTPPPPPPSRCKRVSAHNCTAHATCVHSILQRGGPVPGRSAGPMQSEQASATRRLAAATQHTSVRPTCGSASPSPPTARRA